MKCTATPEQMEQRRKERLRHLRFFMLRPELPASFRGNIARDACLELLTGWFRNSRWAVCRYVFREALEQSWEEFKFSAWLFWQYRIMRRSREEIAKLIHPDEEEEDWPSEIQT